MQGTRRRGGRTFSAWCNPCQASKPGRAAPLVVMLLCMFAPQALAQSYPTRPVRMIVPFPPGGPNDIFARLVAQLLQDALGQQIVVDNRGGAGGAIGAELAARSAPDGYSLFLGGAATLAISPSMGRRLPYDALKDFTSISLLATAPSVLLAHPALPVRTVKDLVALAKSKAGQITYASAGVGTNPHLAGELFKHMAGVDLVHVPYKGGGPATADLLAGQVPLYFSGVSIALPFVKENRVRPIAVTSLQRTALMPDVPTFAESGLPGYEVSNWYAVLGPSGMSPSLVKRLHADLTKGMAQPALRKRVLDLGADPVAGSPDQLTAYIKAEITKWTKVIRDAGIKPD